MKKQQKWLTYLLALLVVFIWGVILQRILARTGSPATRELYADGGNVRAEKLPVMLPDTFSLLLNYPDPFLTSGEVAVQPGSGLAGGQGSGGQTGTVGAMGTIAVAKVAVDPPLQLSYLGFVQNTAGKKRVAIINFNGKELMLSEGETAGELQLLAIGPGHVTVKINKQLKHIKQSI